MIKTGKILSFILLFFIFTLIMSNNIYAQHIEVDETIKLASVINPDNFKPSNPSQSDVDTMLRKSNVIIGTIQIIGTVVAVITLMVLGLKYMMGSVEEKASYKKTMIPYLIGAVLVFSITQFIVIIAKVVK